MRTGIADGEATSNTGATATAGAAAMGATAGAADLARASETARAATVGIRTTAEAAVGTLRGKGRASLSESSSATPNSVDGGVAGRNRDGSTGKADTGAITGETTADAMRRSTGFCTAAGGCADGAAVAGVEGARAAATVDTRGAVDVATGALSACACASERCVGATEVAPAAAPGATVTTTPLVNVVPDANRQRQIK